MINSRPGLIADPDAERILATEVILSQMQADKRENFFGLHLRTISPVKFNKWIADNR
jgi:hypothetical protein